MKEFILLVLVYALFLIGSRTLFRVAAGISRKWIWIYFVGYLVAVYFYFDFLNRLDNALGRRSIYLEFGHAKFLFVLLMLISFFTAFAFIIIEVRGRKRQRDGK